jgi:hypothetical protein
VGFQLQFKTEKNERKLAVGNYAGCHFRCNKIIVLLMILIQFAEGMMHVFFVNGVEQVLKEGRMLEQRGVELFADQVGRNK